MTVRPTSHKKRPTDIRTRRAAPHDQGLDGLIDLVGPDFARHWYKHLGVRGCVL